MHELSYAVVLGLVEGITEFIPVSSTGHLIVTGHLLGFTGPKAASFEIFIQLGAILAVVFLYKERFLQLFTRQKPGGFAGLHGWVLLGLTSLPALILGALTHGLIKHYLFNPITVAVGLGLGGLAILAVERFRPRVRKSGLDALEWPDALAIGCFQCFALWPGVSRSASTILGAMTVGISRDTAAQYSFLAAVPVMVAATSFDLYKSLPLLDASDLPLFSLGFAVSFVAAWFAVRSFIQFLGTHTLILFGWYRIVLAPIILWVFAS
jgi:undecaprenyl-diphosphatase